MLRGRRRTFLFLTAASGLVALMAFASACGDDEDAQQQQAAAAEEAKKKAAAGASTVFIPDPAPAQPGLPPGAGPYNGPPPVDDPPPPPKDAAADVSAPKDSGSGSDADN